MAILRELTVRGYRSLRDVTVRFEAGTTVLAGPNGAGKSNLLGALNLAIHAAVGSVRFFAADAGGASRLLHDGPKTTPELELELVFDHDSGENRYHLRLGHAADDTFFFLDERVGHRTSDGKLSWRSLGTGHRESRLHEAADDGDETARTTRWCMNRVGFYHFHDTTPRSELRMVSPTERTRALYPYGGNLGSFLLSLELGHPAAWRRIGDWVRMVAPAVDRLDPVLIGPRAVPKDELTAERLATLEPPVPVRLDWRDERGKTFGPHDLSDGSLRAIALFTALGQPTESRPFFLAIDEPELGLHPAALDVLCSVVHATTSAGQVLLATQSPRIIDAFDPGAVRIVEREAGATTVRALDEAELARWLDDYSVSQLIDMNVQNAPTLTPSPTDGPP